MWQLFSLDGKGPGYILGTTSLWLIALTNLWNRELQNLAFLQSLLKSTESYKKTTFAYTGKIHIWIVEESWENSPYWIVLSYESVQPVPFITLGGIPERGEAPFFFSTLIIPCFHTPYWTLLYHLSNMGFLITYLSFLPCCSTVFSFCSSERNSQFLYITWASESWGNFIVALNDCDLVLGSSCHLWLKGTGSVSCYINVNGFNRRKMMK